MKILLLGNNYLLDILKNKHDVTHLENIIKLENITDFDFIVSYGYRYIIKKNIIDYFHKRIINLHISYLPYNRGADPNLWSILEDTPSGVTIHYIDDDKHTSDTSITFTPDILPYVNQKLANEIQKLNKFVESWNSNTSSIIDKNIACQEQMDKIERLLDIILKFNIS